MLLSELNNIFQVEFNEILSQQSTNVKFFLSHNRIQRIKMENKGPKTYSFGHAGQPCFRMFCVGIRHMYSALTYDVRKSYLTRGRDKKIRMAILHWKQGLLCDLKKKRNV